MRRRLGQPESMTDGAGSTEGFSDLAPVRARRSIVLEGRITAYTAGPLVWRAALDARLQKNPDRPWWSSRPRGSSTSTMFGIALLFDLARRAAENGQPRRRRRVELPATSRRFDWLRSWPLAAYDPEHFVRPPKMRELDPGSSEHAMGRATGRGWGAHARRRCSTSWKIVRPRRGRRVLQEGAWTVRPGARVHLDTSPPRPAPTRYQSCCRDRFPDGHHSTRFRGSGLVARQFGAVIFVVNGVGAWRCCANWARLR